MISIVTVLVRNAETVKNYVFLTWVIFIFQRLEQWFWDFNRDCIGEKYGNGQESRFSDLDYFHRLDFRGQNSGSETSIVTVLGEIRKQ